MTLEQKYKAILEAIKEDEFGCHSIGIHNFGLLHRIADKLKIKNNSGSNLRYLSHRITNICRELIEAGYPIEEYRIKTCSWTSRETWHPCFEFEEYTKGR